MNTSDKRQQRLAGFDDDPPDQPTPESVDHDTRRAVIPVEGAGSRDPALLRGKQIYVIDAHSLIYQVFHALPEMTSPSGQPAGAIYGFLRDIVDLLQRKAPDYLLCAFDEPGKTFRHTIYDQYKITRPEMPPDLQPQIPNIRRFLAAMAIPVLSLSGYEADDILATVARQAEDREGRVFLVTADKDCRQLITQNVSLYNIRRDQVIDRETVIQQWGITPEQVVDFQALWGDTTDNIPGVPGIGKKTAGQLLSEFNTIEGIYEHLDQIKGNKRRENLTESRELIQLSRQLVTLADNVPIDLDWDRARVGGLDAAGVLGLCQEFGFGQIAQRLTGLSAPVSSIGSVQHYETITTESALSDLVETLARQKRIAVDTETTSTRPRQARIVGYSFAWKPNHAVYIPVRAPAGSACLDPDRTRDALRPILENPDIAKIGQNLKYDMVVLRGAGIRLQGVSFDTMVADYLLAPGQRNHGLDDLAKRYLNHTTIKISELIGTGKKQKQMDEIPVERVAPYAAEDADIPLRLAADLAEQLRCQDLESLFQLLEMPLIDVLAEMEFNGITVDVQHLRHLSEQFGQELARLRSEIHTMAGYEFNIESRKQLGRILFEELGLPVLKRTKTGPSTDAAVLNELAELDPLPAKILEYRSHAKLKSTYVDALPALVNPTTGRVHTSFKQDVAATGRLSSTDPNLQNIPVRTAAGREIRKAFIPGPPAWCLLCADYSQIELRVLAHFSNDRALLDAFARDLDIHAQVASQVQAVPLEEVTSSMRRRAKAINFGIIYGQSAFGLAKSLDISQADAADFIKAYFEQYPGVERFIGEILDQCAGQGFVTTALGRRRAIEGIRETAVRKRSKQRNLPERIAINTVIQGSAADLIKQAMIRIHRRLASESFQSKLLLQIHDELMFETPAAEQDRLVEVIHQEMTAVGDLCVPLKVDMKAGPNWADCVPLSVCRPPRRTHENDV